MKKSSRKLAALGTYDPAKIESKWQKKWATSKIYKSKEDSKRDKYYALDMFPYPSGEGLHVGHPKGYIATDIVSRMMRMHGKSVLHPMGFDAFGLPAENYAIKTKTNPADSVKKNVARYKKQLEILGFDYDWSREVNTTDPNYYKWTQWVFLQLFKKGLAYESYEPINWCPVDKTGLANEEVIDGRCERCGALVEKKPMRQWVLKITDYAERLLDDLDARHDYVMPKLIDKANPHQPGKPLVKRTVAHAIVFDPKTHKYLIIRNKKFGWDTVIIGGIENEESPIDTARREVREETGYTDLEFKSMLGHQTEAHYYTKHKGENRIAYAQAVYFELKSDARVPIGADEDKDDEVLWIDEKDFVPGKMVNSEMPIWLERLKDPMKGWAEPLLDWPESIKEAQRNWIGRSEGAEIDFRMALANKKPRFVILHGYSKDGAKSSFIPWLKKVLESRGHEVEAPEMPNPKQPKETEQVEFVLKNCKFDESTVIIGHSLGAVVAMKLIMKLDRKVSGLVIVASAVDPGFDKYYAKRPFHNDFKWNYDFGQIKRLTGGSIAVLSDTKEKYRAPYLKHLATQLNAALTEVEAVQEHFRADQEPEVLKSVTPTIKVFTTRPDTLFGVTYVVLTPEHPWLKDLLERIDNKAEVEAYILKSKAESEIERTDATKEKTGVELKGIKAINPANNEEVPIYIADYVLADYGTGAVMAVPAHDERDFEFAKKFGLGIKQVVAPETGIRRINEEKRNGGCAVIFDPNTQKYAVSEEENKKNYFRFFGGGVDENEELKEGVLREVREESGLYDFDVVEEIGTAFPHFYNSLKNVNRIARATCFLIILKSNRTQATKLEAHEKFKLKWVDAEELQKDFTSWNKDKDVDHWLWFLSNSVGRAIELGYDWTSSKTLFKQNAYLESGLIINSGKFNGKNSDSVMKEITTFAGGKWVTTYKLRDWVFSRQRYWGEPIPVIHCPTHGAVPVPEKDLPVVLPKVKSYEPTGTGESPLAAIDKWVNTKCPICKQPAKRETNTMPQWAGSSWYYIAYCMTEYLKSKTPISKQISNPKFKKSLENWLPVDIYVGGAEHATRHLIYARFWHKFLYDIGVVSTIEPFTRLQSVGLIMGEDGQKMSKRFGNVVNPDTIVKSFGADTLRIYEMFMGPFAEQIAWSTASMAGTRRFIEKVWRLANNVSGEIAVPALSLRQVLPASANRSAGRIDLRDASGTGNFKLLHKAIKKVTDDIKNFRFNTAVSSLMILVNELEKAPSISREHYEILLKLLAPFAPHVTEELWISLGNKKSIHISEWPIYDQQLAADDEVTIVIQVNGKVRGSFRGGNNMTNDEAERLAKEAPELKKWLEGKSIKKVIVVPGRLVNIVI